MKKLWARMIGRLRGDGNEERAKLAVDYAVSASRKEESELRRLLRYAEAQRQAEGVPGEPKRNS